MGVTILFLCCFFLSAGHAVGQDTSDLQEDLRIIRRAFKATNEQPRVVTNSTERSGFWGQWDNGRLITQVDDKKIEGQYLLNPNPRGSHDFFLVKHHRREQVLPRGSNGNSSVRNTAKTVSETVFLDGNMRMRFKEASVAIFRRVPKGWFNVETFSVRRLPPAASYLQAVDYQFVLRQNALLDLSLLQRRYIAKIERLSGDDIPAFVTGRCFSVNFTDAGFALRSSLGLGSNDFSGFEFSDTFRNDLYRAASIFFKVCITPKGAEKEPLVLFTEASRSGSEIPTRLAGRDITMRFLGQKETMYEYVDQTKINFPLVNGASRKSHFLVGWFVAAALVLWL